MLNISNPRVIDVLNNLSLIYLIARLRALEGEEGPKINKCRTMLNDVLIESGLTVCDVRQLLSPNKESPEFKHRGKRLNQWIVDYKLMVDTTGDTVTNKHYTSLETLHKI